MSKNYKFNTLQLHAGQSIDKSTGACAVPIYQTAAYGFESADQAEDLFALKQAGNIYTRIMNPTNDVLEKRIAALEGGVAALAVSSGSAAIYYSIINIASQGDEIVASNKLYGGTYNLFANRLREHGITTKFVDGETKEDFKNEITSKTKAIYIETIGNPNATLLDIEGIAEVAHEVGIPLIVDNTFASPYLTRPIEYGADIVIHSATKFIGGHGTTVGGVIVDSGNFNWEDNERFPGFNEPDESYHGIRYGKDVGNIGFILKIRVQWLRDTGAALSPFNGFLLLQGLETLSLRVKAHVENTKKIVEFLSNHPGVVKVNYPSLENSKYYELAKKYTPKGAGSIFTFEIKGGRKEAKNFIDKLELFTHLANVADAKSLVIHPASTTHSQLSTHDLLKSGIKDNTIRLSVGIEDVEDLIDDLAQALN